TEYDSVRSEIETLHNQIVSLRNTNEENIRRIAELDSQKLTYEQENIEKDRQLKECDEKFQELQLTLKQTQESGIKLRKALHKMKETITNNEQTHNQELEIRLRMVTEEYEQKLNEQEAEYSTKLKSLTKEMNSQMEEKEKQFNQQHQELIDRSYQNENNMKHRIIEAEQRASVAEEQLKNKQINQHLIQELENQINDLQTQIESFNSRENIPIQTTDHAAQTNIEDSKLHSSLTNSNDTLHSLVVEPTEIDYLKQIIFAYMTGTDPMTMVKVICALLRYTDDEKSVIIEHEKYRQTRWLNTPR
ncbi:unnamed protein product, partial [Rotaria sordida]